LFPKYASTACCVDGETLVEKTTTSKKAPTKPL
jgi:hypothetical protein